MFIEILLALNLTTLLFLLVADYRRTTILKLRFEADRLAIGKATEDAKGGVDSSWRFELIDKVDIIKASYDIFKPLRSYYDLTKILK